MIAMDLIRFAALLTIPVTYAFGWLSFGQLLAVSVIVAAAKIAFNSASGAFLKTIVAGPDLLVANSRFESTSWTATVLGPPLGGAMIGFLGPVVTTAADAVSYLLSAAGIGAIGGHETPPDRAGTDRLRAADLLDGWRYTLAHPVLRRLLVNSILVGGLILATEPLIAVLMLGELHFAPWQYGLAFAAPCVGGLIGARLARRLATRFGLHRVMITAGTLSAGWPVWLAFVRPGVAGIVLVIGVQFGLVSCMGVFNPLYATYRLEQTAQDRVARVLSAWQVTKNVTIAALTALWGGLATLTSPRIGIAAAGLLLLGTPLLLPRPRQVPAGPATSPTSKPSALAR
jgi:hypothetical protein